MNTAEGDPRYFEIGDRDLEMLARQPAGEYGELQAHLNLMRSRKDMTFRAYAMTAILGHDEDASRLAREAVATSDSPLRNHALVQALRHSCMAEHGRGYDAGILIAFAHMRSDFSIDNANSDKHLRTEVYCLREQEGPSTLSVHLGRGVWLLEDMDLWLPAIPDSIATTLEGRPMRDVLDHRMIHPEDMVERVEKSSDGKMTIRGIKRRPVATDDLSPVILKR